MKKTILFFLSASLFLYSCKKVIEAGAPAATVHANTDKAFLNNVISDPPSEYYIKGEFDGHMINCAAGWCNQDTFFNAFYVFPTSDQLNLIRQTGDGAIQIAFYGSQTHINNRTFPYIQPHLNPESCEQTEINLTNLKAINRAGQGSPQDNYDFFALTDSAILGRPGGSGIKLTFSSRSADSILEGKFEGLLKTKTGSEITVKNGEFRIKSITVKY